MFYHRYLTIVSWFTILLLGVQPVLGLQESGAVLSLPGLVAEARRANLDLVVARKRWEAAQARIPQAKALPAPKIGVEFEEIPRGTVKLNQATLMYQLIQSLPFPGKLSARHRVAVAEAQMAAAAYKQAEWNLVGDVKITFYEIYQMDREKETNQQSLFWLEQLVQSAQARYAAGQGSYAELLQAQARKEEAANMNSVLEHRRLGRVAHFNHLLNRPAHQQLGQMPDIALQDVPDSPEILFQKALQQQPELLMFQYAAERADASYRLSKRELFPDLETMFELRDPAMGPVGPWDLSLAVALPFWFWTKAHYGVKAALYDKESAEAAYLAMRNEMARRIHERWHMAHAEYEQAVLYRDRLLPLSEQATSAALASYASGMASYADALGTLEEWSTRRREYFKSLAALEQELTELERAVGISLRGES